MPDPVWPVIRVRAVRGRVIDPFRGSLDDDAQRLAPRSVESQPLGDVVAALRAISGIKLTQAGRRYSLRRAGEVLKVSFASAAPRVSLDDAAFEGDGMLVLAALHALLPLFGAVEVQIGRYTDLIDGHEPLDPIVKRYDTWWIEDSLLVARRLEARDAAAKAAIPRPVMRPSPPRSQRRALAISLAVVAVGLGILWALARGAFEPDRGELGEHCSRNADCESRRCLPREPVRDGTAGGIEASRYTRPPEPADPSGVCTTTCSNDADCPATMRCGELVSYGQLGLASRTHGCVPRAWAGEAP